MYNVQHIRMQLQLPYQFPTSFLMPAPLLPLGRRFHYFFSFVDAFKRYIKKLSSLKTKVSFMCTAICCHCPTIYTSQNPTNEPLPNGRKLFPPCEQSFCENFRDREIKIPFTNDIDLIRTVSVHKDLYQDWWCSSRHIRLYYTFVKALFLSQFAYYISSVLCYRRHFLTNVIMKPQNHPLTSLSNFDSYTKFSMLFMKV